MIGKSPDKYQLNLLKQHLENLINPKHPLCKLAKRIPLDDLKKHFGSHYHHTGRPAKPIRLMISFLILKQLYNLSDETIVVEARYEDIKSPYDEEYTIAHPNAPSGTLDTLEGRFNIPKNHFFDQGQYNESC